MGDPAGIGPEVIASAWSRELLDICYPVVVGNPEVMRRAAGIVGRQIDIRLVTGVSDIAATEAILPCCKAADDNAMDAPIGRMDARAGQAAYDCLIQATEMALEGTVDAVVTAPLSKAALWRAGHHYPGHTELLAELCGVPEVAMMLYLAPGPPLEGQHGLGVVHVTLHQGLRGALEHLSTDAVLAKTRLISDFLRRLQIKQPRIGVAALNPHAGEDSLFGDEEVRVIRPAVIQANEEEIQATGPLPADTLMVRARDGEFEGVVAMYHDQGHIALKLLGMRRAVNITLGLPIIRTSVAHGTAFDIAGQGQADPRSLLEAARVARRLWEAARLHASDARKRE